MSTSFKNNLTFRGYRSRGKDPVLSPNAMKDPLKTRKVNRRVPPVRAGSWQVDCGKARLRAYSNSSSCPNLLTFAILVPYIFFLNEREGFQMLTAMSHMAELRSNLNLMKRSRQCTDRDVKVATAQAIHDLEQGILIYPPRMAVRGLRKGMTLQERKAVLDVKDSDPDYTPEEQEFMEYMAELGQQARQANWIFRIGSEALDRTKEGWFPFFVTLTIDPSRVADPEAFWKEGVEWQKYLRRVCKVVTDTLGHKPIHKSYVPMSEYLRYAGVIEHGASREHHHCHALIWMRDVPPSWKRCPNKGVRDPAKRNRQRCLQLESLWPFALPGLKPARYFRCEGDAWTKLGFCIPLDQNGKIVRIHPPFKAGLYCSKYMKKDDKEWNHRIRATRNLGLLAIRKRLMELSLSKLEALSWRPKTYDLSISLQTIHSVPVALLRSLAKQEVFCRKWANKTLDLETLLKQNSDAFKKMRESVQSGHRPKRMPTKVFYEWVGKHLPDPKEYCEVKLRRAHMALQYIFPPDAYQTLVHIGANDYGHS